MKAAWYEFQGSPAEVLQVGELATPVPAAGEVRIRIHASGVNPGDVKKRQDQFGVGMPFPRIIPHSDGAGLIDEVGDPAASSRVGQRVWCFGAQSYRPFGTAAEYVVVPSEQAIDLDDDVSYEQGSCLGIPGITAHRAIHIAGSVRDRVILVQGAAGAVGQCACALARHAGALVLATVRSDNDVAVAERAGAQFTLVTAGMTGDELVDQVHSIATNGVDHIVEVAFHANIKTNERLLRQGGSIAAYATGNPTPAIPFWPLVFKNVSLHFLGSDDFPIAAKIAAASALNDVLASGWPGFEIGMAVPLESIGIAHEAVEAGNVRGRVVVNP